MSMKHWVFPLLLATSGCNDPNENGGLPPLSSPEPPASSSSGETSSTVSSSGQTSSAVSSSGQTSSAQQRQGCTDAPSRSTYLIQNDSALPLQVQYTYNDFYDLSNREVKQEAVSVATGERVELAEVSSVVFATSVKSVFEEFSLSLDMNGQSFDFYSEIDEADWLRESYSINTCGGLPWGSTSTYVFIVTAAQLQQ